MGEVFPVYGGSFSRYGGNISRLWGKFFPLWGKYFPLWGKFFPLPDRYFKGELHVEISPLKCYDMFIKRILIIGNVNRKTRGESESF